MYMYGIWYVPLTCVTALVDRRPPFRTHPPEYCPGTGNRSVGGPDTGWSSTNPHTDKTSAFKAYKHRQLNVLQVNFLWKWHFNTWFYFEIFSNEFHWKHLTCKLDTIKLYHMHLPCNLLLTWNFLTWNANFWHEFRLWILWNSCEAELPV